MSMRQKYLLLEMKKGDPFDPFVPAFLFANRLLASVTLGELNSLGVSPTYGNPHPKGIARLPANYWVIVEESDAHRLDPFYGATTLSGAGEYSL